MKDTSSAFILPRATRMGNSSDPLALHVRMILHGKCDDEVDRWMIGRNTNHSTKEARIEVAKVHLSCLDDERAWVSGPRGYDDLYVAWTDECLVHEADPLIYDERGNFLEESSVVEHVREELIQMERELYGPRESSMSSRLDEQHLANHALKREVHR